METHQKGNKSNIENELSRSVAYDGRRDTAVFQKCLEYYKAKDWSGSIEKLKHFIKKYPEGKYTEKAYFLLIKSYEKLSTRFISDQFNEIKNHCENTLNKFSESNYLHICPLYHRHKSSSRAVAISTFFAVDRNVRLLTY